MRYWNIVDHAVQDLRFASRQLLRHRTFALTATIVLTLGIAGSIAIFGFVDATLIKPLPYEEPSRLVMVNSVAPSLARSQPRAPSSYLDFVDWRTRTHAFASMAAYDVRGGFTVATPAGPQRVPGLRVTSGFFHTLGVTPVLGRDFLPREEGTTAPPAVILSYGAWQSRFGGNPNILGQTITMQSPWLGAAEPHVIVGVLPKDLHFTMALQADLWATIRGPQACWNVRSCRSLEVIARLAASTSPQTATADLTSVIEQLRTEYPQHHREVEVGALVPLRDVMLGNIRPILLMLLAGAGLLLLIGCINVVSLLLARSESRTREIAIRQALGASAARLVRQFATEAFLLTAIATALGLLLATWTIKLLTGLLSADMISRMPYLQTVSVGPRLVLAACAIGSVAGVMFAITPILRTSVGRGRARLVESSRGSPGIYWRRFGAHLVVVELAVALLLVVSAGLLGKSLYRLVHVDLGFNAQGLASVAVTPVSIRASADATDMGHQEPLPPGALARLVAERVAALPGVQSVGYADQLPLGGGLAPASQFWIIGRAEADQLKGGWPVRRIGATYFNTLQARLLRGRYFTEEDVSQARRVIVISETAARRLFPDDDAVGRSIAFGGPTSDQREIVGVVGDIADGPPETPPHPSAYMPFNESGFSLVVRTATSDRAIGSQIQRAIREVDPNVLLGPVTTMADRINQLPSTSLQRASAWLIGGFAGVAFILSVIGLYGVVAYSVGQRTREIGVRMALGAQRASVYRLVMGDASRLVGLGIALGLGGAVAAASTMRRLLFGVESWDPPTLLAAATVLVAAALIASYIPARRAAAVSPIEVLRTE
jgi:predicted permease